MDKQYEKDFGSMERNEIIYSIMQYVSPKNKILYICIGNSKLLTKDDKNKIKKKDKKALQKIFKDDLTEIMNDKVTIKFVTDESLYPADQINLIRRKIYLLFSKVNFVKLRHQYLWINQKQELTDQYIEHLFNTLSNNIDDKIEKKTLKFYLNNVQHSSEEVEVDYDSKYMSITDFYSYVKSHQQQFIYRGARMGYDLHDVAYKKRDNYINIFKHNIKSQKDIIVQYSQKTDNNDLLLNDYAELKNNIIYFCDVLDYRVYIRKKIIDDQKLENLNRLVGNYWSIKYQKILLMTDSEIFSINQNAKKDFDENKLHFKNYNKIVDVVNGVYHDYIKPKKLKIKFDDARISYFKLKQYGSNDKNNLLDLDYIFSLIKLNENIPFVRYRNANDKVQFKIHKNELNVKSNLQQSDVENWIRDIKTSTEKPDTRKGLHFRFLMYYDKNEKHNKYGIVYINSKRDIDLSLFYSAYRLANLKDIKEDIKICNTEIITKINNILYNAEGNNNLLEPYDVNFAFNKYTNTHLYSSNFTLSVKVNNEKHSKLEQIINCLYPYVKVKDSSKSSVLEVFYKRISKYDNAKVMEIEQSNLIEDLRKKGRDKHEIIHALTKNFNLEKEDAKKVYTHHEVVVDSPFAKKIFNGTSIYFSRQFNNNYSIRIQGIHQMNEILNVMIFLKVVFVLFNYEYTDHKISLTNLEKMDFDESKSLNNSDMSLDTDINVGSNELDMDIYDNVDNEFNEFDDDKFDEFADFDVNDVKTDSKGSENTKKTHSKSSSESGTKSTKKNHKTSGIIQDPLSRIHNMTTMSKNLNKYIYKEKNGKVVYKEYNRACQRPKVPVVITKKEKDLIDKYDKQLGKYKSYDGILEYDKDINSEIDEKTLFYMCPKFWCKKDNISIPQEVFFGTKDYKNGKKPKFTCPICYGRIEDNKNRKYIEKALAGYKDPNNGRERTVTVKLDKQTFTTKAEKEMTSTNKGRYPAFTDNCRICCGLNKKLVGSKHYDKCNSEEDIVEDVGNRAYELYVLGANHPVKSSTKYGALNDDLNNLFENNVLEIFRGGQSSGNLISNDVKCFLRVGSESSSLTDALKIIFKGDIFEKIAENLIPEVFVSIANGNFVNMFYNRNLSLEDPEELNHFKNWCGLEKNRNFIEQSRITSILSSSIKQSEIQNDFKYKMAYRIYNSMHNYLNYITNNLEDETYIVNLMKYALYFQEGDPKYLENFNVWVTLAIFEENEVDNKLKTSIKCPMFLDKTHQSRGAYAFLLKKKIGGVYLYEPVCYHMNDQVTRYVLYYYNNETMHGLSYNLNHILDKVRNLLITHCTHINHETYLSVLNKNNSIQIPSTYEIMRNILVRRFKKSIQIMGQLADTNFTVSALILNIKGIKTPILLPIEEHNIVLNYPIHYEIDFELSTYQNYRDFFGAFGRGYSISTQLMNTSGETYALLMSTNHIIPIEPQSEIPGLPSVLYNYDHNIDKMIFEKTKSDDKRSKFYKKYSFIKENYNRLRFEINRYFEDQLNTSIKEVIVQILNNPIYSNTTKFNLVKKHIKSIINKIAIVKQDDDRYLTGKIPQIKSQCSQINKKKCNKDIFCEYHNNHCKLFIMKKHPFEDKENLDYFINMIVYELVGNLTKRNVLLNTHIPHVENHKLVKNKKDVVLDIDNISLTGYYDNLYNINRDVYDFKNIDKLSTDMKHYNTNIKKYQHEPSISRFFNKNEIYTLYNFDTTDGFSILAHVLHLIDPTISNDPLELRCTLLEYLLDKKIKLKDHIKNKPLYFLPLEKRRVKKEIETTNQHKGRKISGYENGKKCIFPFSYWSKEYKRCKRHDKGYWWCATEINDEGKPLKKGICSLSKEQIEELENTINYDEEKSLTEIRGDCKVKGRKNIDCKEGSCKFPFASDGKTHNQCIDNGKDREICATEIDDKRNLTKFGYCPQNKKVTKKKTKTEVTTVNKSKYKIFTTNKLRGEKISRDSYEKNKECIFPFTNNKGISYNHCMPKNKDATDWVCATEVDMEGRMTKKGICVLDDETLAKLRAGKINYVDNKKTHKNTRIIKTTNVIDGRPKGSYYRGKCIFPFTTQNGVTYYNCKPKNKDAKDFLCATEIDEDGIIVKTGVCLLTDKEKTKLRQQSGGGSREGGWFGKSKKTTSGSTSGSSSYKMSSSSSSKPKLSKKLKIHKAGKQFKFTRSQKERPRYKNILETAYQPFCNLNYDSINSEEDFINYFLFRHRMNIVDISDIASIFGINILCLGTQFLSKKPSIYYGNHMEHTVILFLKLNVDYGFDIYLVNNKSKLIFKEKLTKVDKTKSHIGLLSKETKQHCKRDFIISFKMMNLCV
jgi:hypothetical protein